MSQQAVRQYTFIIWNVERGPLLGILISKPIALNAHSVGVVNGRIIGAVGLHMPYALTYLAHVRVALRNRPPNGTCASVGVGRPRQPTVEAFYNTGAIWPLLRWTYGQIAPVL